MDGEVEAEDCIIINIKDTNGKSYDVVINKNGDVEEMKYSIEEQHEIPKDDQRLIYRGRILHDYLTILELGIEEGHCVRLVRGKGKKAEQATAVPVTRDESRINVGGMSMDANMMRSFANSPFLDFFEQNPDLIRQQMFASMPGLQDTANMDPAVSAALNNPDTVKSMIRMMRNPSLLEDMSRSADHQMTQLSNTPGGNRMLERVMHAMQPTGSPFGRSAPTPSTPAPPPNVPLPNPWVTGQQPTGNLTIPAAAAAPSPVVEDDQPFPRSTSGPASDSDDFTFQ
eukprot:gene19681-30331_t